MQSLIHSPSGFGVTVIIQIDNAVNLNNCKSYEAAIMFVGFVLGKVYKANCDVFRAELTSGNRSNRANMDALLKLERVETV